MIYNVLVVPESGGKEHVKGRSRYFFHGCAVGLHFKCQFSPTCCELSA